ncbi:sensor histidine kinase [Virgibacillus sp. W0181]|uniref:sensor histidine kinase n=1 Tax=Virgibacillus sp. W0181 TaxID=3391581 RepID=UPI003F4751B6
MHRWYSIFPKNPWLSIYTWIAFCLLPFFFIFKSSSPLEILIGISLLFLFFLSYRFSFKSKSGLVYMWLSFEMIINIAMTLLFGFVYFALFTAFFIGNIKSTTGFFIMYGLHIATTLGAVLAGFFIEIDLLLPQLHFILLCLIGTVLLPFHLYNRNKQENLEGQLEVANERISELVIFEERQRIARDLHDTLGQKLSLIGLKSDLVAKLMTQDPERADKELSDIRTTASTALNEVRELVSNMRSKKLEKEVVRVQQILKAAEMELTIHGEPNFDPISPLIENILCMCMKEAVTNVVKHSYGNACHIFFKQSTNAFIIKVKDDGIGIPQGGGGLPGNGIDGIKERLEFVNGHLEIDANMGTSLTITVPAVIKQINRGE